MSGGESKEEREKGERKMGGRMRIEGEVGRGVGNGSRGGGEWEGNYEEN